MIFRTHLALGFLIALLSFKFLDISHPLTFIILVTLFASFPDIDHSKSKIGRKLLFISIPISLFFKHRGFFHSIFPPVIFFIILIYFNISFLAFSIAVGYVAHLLGDAITKEGIRLLNPFASLRIHGPIKTGSKLEAMLFVVLIVVNIAYVLKILNIIL